MKFDVRFLHGSADAAVTAFHLHGPEGKPEETPFATATLHLVSPTEVDASVVLAREEFATQERLNEVLLQLNGVLHSGSKRTLRHAELFVQATPPAAKEREIKGFQVLSSVNTPTSHRLWLREAAGPDDKGDAPVSCMIDILLTNPFMATLCLVPTDGRLVGEQPLRSLIHWLIDSVPFLVERKGRMQEMAIKAHPSRYLGGADIKAQPNPPAASEQPGTLPDKWPGLS
jgi:hypothetical protein